MHSARNRFLRVAALCVLAGGLTAGVVSSGSAFAGGKAYSTTGAAAASIDDSGNVAATVAGSNLVNAATSSVTLGETIVNNTGIGSSTIKVSGTTADDGTFGPISFSSPGLSRPAYSGTASGTLMTGPGDPAAGASFVLTLHCVITYPPLAANCAVTAKWKV